MKPELTSSKFYADYQVKMEREMQKFNGKIQVGEGTETNSEVTTITKKTGKSSGAGKS